MIYDLGCLSSSGLPDKILRAVPGAAAVLAVIAGLALIGALPKRDRQFQVQDIFSGWGIVATVLTLAAVSSTYALPLATFALFLLIAAAAFPAVKRRYFSAPFWLLALFPGLFILMAINIAGIAKWDDFAHWVPNALYLFRFDSVPALSLSAPRSAWPTYPYGLPFLTYMASWLAGGFVMQGGAMFNFLMLAGFAAMLTDFSPLEGEVRWEVGEAKTDPPTAKTNDLLRKSKFSLLPPQGEKNFSSPKFSLKNTGLTAFALLLVTLLNPGFNASFSVTSQGDTSTSVLIGALALMLWEMTNKLTANDRSGANTLRLPLILSGVALICVKQSDLALLGLLLIGFLVVAARNRIFKPAVLQAVLMFAGAFAVRFVWQSYVDTEMPGARAFSMRALSEWRFDLAPAILGAMLKAMLKANGLSLLMLGIAGYGTLGFFRKPTPPRNFAVMAGITYLGYLPFLLTTYIGASFHEDEAARATSFYRYCTHTSLLGISFLWMIAPSLWERLKSKFRMPVLSALQSAGAYMITRPPGVALLAGLLPLITLIHAGLLVPQPTREICADRDLGHRLADALPDHSRLSVIEPESEGLFTFIINFELTLGEVRTGNTLDLGWHTDAGSKAFNITNLSPYLKRLDENPPSNALLVPQAGHAPVTVAGESNADGPITLIRDGEGWKRINP